MRFLVLLGLVQNVAGLEWAGWVLTADRTQQGSEPGEQARGVGWLAPTRCTRGQLYVRVVCGEGPLPMCWKQSRSVQIRPSSRGPCKPH